DEVGAEFRRRMAIRDRARQLAMENDSKEAIQKAIKTTTSPTRRWNIGQWVYVFRRAKPGDSLHPTSRWVGPGLVIMNSQGIVWVAMRTRLWRCTSEQLRPAFPSEVLGSHLSSDPELAELLRKVTSNTRAGAVDVAREGPPPGSGDEQAPVQQIVPDGLPVDEPQATQRAEPALPPGEMPGAPESFLPVPPGLVGPQGAPLPEMDPHLHGGVHSTATSRRSSVEEPAQEPEVPAPLDPIAEESSPGDTAERQEPPRKAPRTEEGTRAPGTPIHQLLRVIRSRRDQPESSRPAEASPREASRSPRREDPDHSLLTWFSFNTEGELNFLAKRNDEISLKDLNEAEAKMFDESDAIEWKAILNSKAVRVIHGAEADAARKKWGDRILSSRMVRRKKPLPEDNRWKAKSRWCVGGHTDPDTGTLTTYAPTPQGEGMMAFIQTSLNLKHSFAFTDVKNAFCQSDKIRREAGPLFAEPCEGLGLPSGSLIVLDVPVYGLDDAPACWRATVVSYLVKDLGYVRNLVEPCWLMKFEYEADGKARNVSQILLEVDDFIVTVLPSHEKQVEEELRQRFTFGKWEKGAAEYAGRRVRTFHDKVLIDQGKYIREQVRPVPLEKHRKQDRKAVLNETEFQLLRSAIYKVNWLAKESRPEMAGLASIMASRLSVATIDDVLTVNKCINHLHNTADRALTIWRFDPKEMAFVVVTDAGGISIREGEEDADGLPMDATQGAWAVIATEHLPVGRERVKGSILAWRSSKLKRKVFSSFGGEAQAMLQGVNEVDWLQVMIRDAAAHDVQLRNWRNSLSPHMLVLRGDCHLHERQQQCSVTDAKSLFDCILKEHPQGRQDRKAALELSIVVKDLQDTQSMVRWTPHQKNIVDGLTKSDPLKSNGAMEDFIRQGVLSLVDVSEELQNRASDARFRRRSHSASIARRAEEHKEAHVTLWAALIWGNCDTSPEVLGEYMSARDLRTSCVHEFAPAVHFRAQLVAERWFERTMYPPASSESVPWQCDNVWQYGWAGYPEWQGEDPWAEAARQLIRVATVNGAESHRQDYHQDLQHSRELLEQEFLYLQDNGLHPEFLKVLSQDNQPVQEHQAVLDSHYILEKMGEVPDGHGVLHLRKGISRSEKVLRSLGWEMQVDFEHLSETELVAPTYLDAILRVMHLKAGVRDDDEKRQAFKDVIHGAARRKDESLGQFATRRIRDFTKAATYGITLPPEFRVSLMKEGAGLSDQNLQNLAVLTQGKETDVDFLAAVMARMDVRTDRLSGYAAGEDPSSVTFAEGVNEESSFENHESEGEDSIDDEVILAELEDLNFSEDQAQMVFAILENRPPRRRRTWKENKMFKAEARKDRRPFRKGDSAPEGGRASGGRAGLSRDQLKKISTCRNCGRKGHWAEDCQQPKSGGQGGDRGRVSGFCYLGHPVPGGSGFCGLTSSEWRQIVSAAKSVTDIEVPEMLTFLTLKSGTAILDIGATQDLIGECALSALSHVLAKAGLKYIEVPVDSQGPPTGIGGAATVTRAVLVPISPGGVPGVVHFTVIKENVPPLLSVGLLEHLGATLDLVSNEVHFQSINVVQPMQKEASGHRTIPLVEWDGSCFPVPKEARERFGLSEDSFMLTSKSKLSSAYAKQSEAPGDLHSVHVAFGCRKPHDMKLDSSQSRKLSLCQPFVESRLDRVQPSSSGELIRPEREHPVALSAAFGPMSRSLAEQRWRALVNRLFFMMETTRMMYVRLVMAEKGQKSVKSDRRTYIESANQAPGKCLHAGPRINRGNQYASWQVCKVCNARINYASRGRSKAKPKAKASGAAVVTSTTSARTQGPIFEPNPRKNTPLEAPPTATSSSSTTSPEVATALQMMAAGFQQLNSTMAELMKGQSQMIMMMANAAPSKPFDQMTFDETSKMAAQATTEHFAMNVDEEDDENGSWSPVAPQVATLDDRGPLGLVLWHELRDGNGQVQARGPGEPRWEDSGECHQARYWVIDEKMAHLFYMHDNSIGVYGMNAKGEESPCGPFWHFSAELLEEHELGEAAVAVHNDGEEALRRLAGLARGRSRELQQNHIDILEVFHAGAFSAMAQQNGLKVLECPTRYSKEKGWSGLESKERRQLRQALRDYRPRLVAMRLESVEDYSPGKPRPSEVSRIKESVQGALALEIAEAQLDHNSYFLLEAPRTSELWKSDRMSRLLALPDLAVIPGEFGTQLITNDLGISQNLMSTARGKLSSEELPKRGKPCASHETSAAPAPHKTNKVFRKAETMAGVLLRRGDFSHQACRRLLKSIPWKELPLGKSGTSPLARERRCTVTLGQFTHGGVGGITRATELIPEATRFFNRYLTLQGATGPRSSLTIGINSCLSYRRDVHNVGMNSTIALGQFSGGQVWVEDPEGSDWREISPDRWMRGSLGGTGVQSAGIRGHGLPPTSPRPRPPGFLHSKNYNFVEAGEDTDGEHDNEGETTTETQGEHRPRLRVSEEQKKLIRKLHINTGHPPMERFLRTMRAAGALPHVLEYIRDHFKCDDCEIKVRADSRRRAQCPRLYTFNRVLSVDIMYLRFQERQVPIMNMVCTGTNYHVAVRVPGSNGTPSSSSTWKTFLETWVRYIGAPSLVISDGGNEFKGAFERGLEQLGCLQHVCAAESPWQNAKSERHGGWLKRRLTQEVESGR
ncbi:unnamed protein product, partial [Symbiodinium microadriaticum]